MELVAELVGGGAYSKRKKHLEIQLGKWENLFRNLAPVQTGGGRLCLSVRLERKVLWAPTHTSSRRKFSWAVVQNDLATLSNLSREIWSAILETLSSGKSMDSDWGTCIPGSKEVIGFLQGYSKAVSLEWWGQVYCWLHDSRMQPECLHLHLSMGTPLFAFRSSRDN